MGANKLSVNTISGSKLQYVLKIDLSKDVIFHVIFENIKFEAHSYGLHFSKKVKSFRKSLQQQSEKTFMKTE